jgi:hypothetical protein
VGWLLRRWFHVLGYRLGLDHPHDAVVANDEQERRYLPGLTSTRTLWCRELWHPARTIRGDNRDLNNWRFALYRVGTTSRTIEAR